MSLPEAQPRESGSPSSAPARNAQLRLRDANQNLFVGVHGKGDGGPEVQGPMYGNGNGAEGGVVRSSSQNGLLPRQGLSGLRNMLIAEKEGCHNTSSLRDRGALGHSHGVALVLADIVFIQ